VIWGIDLGVRSVHLAGLDGDDLVYIESIEVPKRVVRSLELDALGKRATEFIAADDDVFVERPPFAGPRNLRTYGELHQVFGTMLSHVGGREAENMTWKKDVVGAGNASKADVSRWLQDHHPLYSHQCVKDQNLVDAVCIALYGKLVVARAEVL
jgi:hypothetical protein